VSRRSDRIIRGRLLDANVRLTNDSRSLTYR